MTTPHNIYKQFFNLVYIIFVIIHIYPVLIMQTIP